MAGEVVGLRPLAKLPSALRLSGFVDVSEVSRMEERWPCLCLVVQLQSFSLALSLPLSLVVLADG